MKEQIITLKESRKLLGDYGNKYDDTDLQNLINNLDAIVCLYFKMIPNSINIKEIQMKGDSK